jgi:hypothetical protein
LAAHSIERLRRAAAAAAEAEEEEEAEDLMMMRRRRRRQEHVSVAAEELRTRVTEQRLEPLDTAGQSGIALISGYVFPNIDGGKKTCHCSVKEGKRRGHE